MHTELSLVSDLKTHAHTQTHSNSGKHQGLDPDSDTKSSSNPVDSLFGHDLWVSPRLKVSFSAGIHETRGAVAITGRPRPSLEEKMRSVGIQVQTLTPIPT